MRLSFVLELLLVFLFLAFAAARVIDNNERRIGRAKKPQKRQGPPNRYCACTASMCNCCRDFSLPVVPLKGPGCASLQYLQNDNMLVTMSFGDRVLANTTVSGKKPKPVCMGLPGGISQFCGRVYGISRSGEEFKACLGLELRALDDIEAALRVSCFKFGPKGVNLEAAPPVPVDEKEKEDDDDDDDDYGLDDDDDEDDDDDDDTFGLDVDDDDDDDDNAATSQDNEVDADDSADYAGFSVLGEDLLGGLFGDDDSGEKKKKKKIKAAKPVKENTTTKRPLLPNRPTIRPNPPRVTGRPIVKVTLRPNKNKQKPSAAVPDVTAAEPTTTIAPKTATNASVLSSTTPSIIKSTEMPMTLPSQAPTTSNVSQTQVNTTEKAAASDIGLLQTDMAKLEAVAAIAQQDVTATVLVTPTTAAPKQTTGIPKITTEPTLAGKQKNAVPINSVDDVDDEDDLFDGMIGQVATIVGADDETAKKAKPITSQIKKKVDTTKKGDLASSSVNTKPDKKPSDDEDPIDFLSSVVGVDDVDDDDDDDDDEETDDEDDDDEEDESGENNSIEAVGGSNEGTKNDDDDDEDDVDNLFDSVIGDDDDDQASIKGGSKKGSKATEKPGTSDESDEADDDEDDDEDDILSGVIDDDDDEKKPQNEPPEKVTESQKNDDEDDILSVLEEDDEEEENNTSDASVPTPSTEVPVEKPESNLVDSNEEGATEMEDVTDYESEESKEPELISTTTAAPVTSTEKPKEEEGNEKSATATLEVKDKNDDDDDDGSADLEIEGDIGLGADDEDRQIKKIRQIVGEAKKGRAPANWSIFLRPGKRFGAEPVPGSARGDRSSRVHRRMNLERIS